MLVRALCLVSFQGVRSVVGFWRRDAAVAVQQSVRLADTARLGRLSPAPLSRRAVGASVGVQRLDTHAQCEYTARVH